MVAFLKKLGLFIKELEDECPVFFVYAVSAGK